MSKPTIILVPGSFCPASAYSRMISHFRARGFPALAIELLSAQKRIGFPPATMQDDAALIKQVAETVIAQDKEVVVICHSYGGTPTSQALVGVKVKRIVYLTAVAPKVGQTQNTSMDISVPMETTEGYMHIDAAVSTAYICNDLPWDQAYEHVLKMPHHSAASFSDPVRQVAYGEVPISYIVCENDMIIAPNVQRKFVQVLEEANQDVHVVSFDSGHCPNFSKPEEVADILAAEVDRD